MPERIPQSVAIRVPLQAYLASDHVSPATGKTIAITISKNGAAYGNPSGGATNATEIGSGSYYVDLSTTDAGTTGPLFVKGTEGTIDTIIAIYNVVGAHNGGFDGIADAAAGASGGLLINGSNSGTVTLAALTVTGAFTISDGIAITCSTLNRSAFSATGNGTGHGGKFISGNGATGDGLRLQAASTAGCGLIGTGSGGADGASFIGGDTGDGLSCFGGATSGSGTRFEAVAGNSDGFICIGIGTEDGIHSQGGATGHGFHSQGGLTSGAATTFEARGGNSHGLELIHVGNGKDFQATTTPLVLAKTTNITGFNDIAATDVVSGGAITTSSGAVSNVTTVGSVTGGVTVTTNNDKTGYSLTQSFPTNFAALGISVGGHISNVDTLTTYTGDTPQTGDTFALANGASGFVAIKTDTGNLVTRITATLFSGITSLAQWLGLLAGKQVGDTTARTEVRATGAGSGTYDETTDSQQAIRDENVTLLGNLQADTDDIQTRIPAALSTGGFMMSDVEEVLGTAAQPTGITIRKNVALANFEFPMFDAADGKTLKTGLTITATMSLDGAAFAPMTNTASEVGTSGIYKINLAQADDNADTVTYMFDGGPTANVTIISFTTQP